MSRQLDAATALDRYFLETRCKIIEIAANLDRIDGGNSATSVANDPRLAQIRAAMDVLMDGKDDRARRCQMMFSLAYDEGWKVPNA